MRSVTRPGAELPPFSLSFCRRVAEIWIVVHGSRSPPAWEHWQLSFSNSGTSRPRAGLPGQLECSLSSPFPTDAQGGKSDHEQKVDSG